jgi:hypothetical protein
LGRWAGGVEETQVEDESPLLRCLFRNDSSGRFSLSTHS